jgi:signal transduction histidine kinase
MDKALDALDRLDAQLARSLARIRMTNTGDLTQSWTDLSSTVTRFARLFGKMAVRDGKRLTLSCAPDLMVRVDAQDFEEILGNLLDNALKWSKQSIALSARRLTDSVELVLEDDGVGIKENDRSAALLSGRRLDTSKPGTGLGLAIATDLLKAYGGALELGASQTLGGLSVRVVLPMRK